MPPANLLTARRDERALEFPLVLQECDCGSFQLRDCLDERALYEEYAYVTPRVPSLQAHYDTLVRRLISGGYAGPASSVLEIGSNAGHFLAAIRPHVGSVTGVDPARSIARAATQSGIPTIARFFDADFARRYRSEKGPADLVVIRHALAHNCDPYVVLDGISEVLADDGALLVENAYAISTLERNEYDQIYHEHMFYFTLLALREMLSRRGFAPHDVLETPVHGGSIVCIAKRGPLDGSVPPHVAGALERERRLLRGGLAERFASATGRLRTALQENIAALSRNGSRIYAYGASAKGATLLNAGNLTYRDIPYCADSTPSKWGRYMPKCGVEIVAEEWAFAHPPDVFVLTAWNYRDELVEKARRAGLASVRFLTPIPEIALSS